jgi:hypothetical protein
MRARRGAPRRCAGAAPEMQRKKWGCPQTPGRVAPRSQVRLSGSQPLQSKGVLMALLGSGIDAGCTRRARWVVRRELVGAWASAPHSAVRGRSMTSWALVDATTQAASIIASIVAAGAAMIGALGFVRARLCLW